MAREGYNAEEIEMTLRSVEVLIASGMRCDEAARVVGVTYSTIRRWRRRFRTQDRKQYLQALEIENARLRKAVAELDLPLHVVNALRRGSLQR